MRWSHTLVLPKKHPSRVAPVSGKSTHEAWCIAKGHKEAALRLLSQLDHGEKVNSVTKVPLGQLQAGATNPETTLPERVVVAGTCRGPARQPPEWQSLECSERVLLQVAGAP